VIIWRNTDQIQGSTFLVKKSMEDQKTRQIQHRTQFLLLTPINIVHACDQFCLSLIIELELRTQKLLLLHKTP